MHLSMAVFYVPMIEKKPWSVKPNDRVGVSSLRFRTCVKGLDVQI